MHDALRGAAQRLPLLCGLLVAFVLLTAPGASASPTHVSGTISQNTTWTLAASPYVLDGNVTVSSGVTLTLEPGVIVKGRYSYGISVYGTFSAPGTSGSPITFTSYKDDTAGGDTNGDGSASAPAKGDWKGLSFWSGGSGSLNHVALRWAGAGWRTPAILLGSGSPTLSLTDSEVAHNKDAAIKTWDGSSTFTVSDCTLADNDGVGIIVTQPQHAVVISGTTIRDGGDYAIELQAGTTAASLANVTLSGNTITGNHKNAIALNGTARSNWQLPAYPEQDDVAYVATGTLTVSGGATLTLDPGVVIKSSGSSSLSVSGALNAQGTAQRPIVFTSLKDDTFAGDSNGDGAASAPAKGDWTGLSFAVAASGSLDHIVVRWTGTGTTSPAIFLSSDATLSLANSQIAHNKGVGVNAFDDPSALTVSDCTLLDNDGVGIKVTSPEHPVSLSGNKIRDGGSYAIELQAGTTAASLANVTLSGNTITGNHKNAVALSGVVRSNWQLPAHPVEEQVAYLATRGLEVATGATLTLDPGVVVKVDNINVGSGDRSIFRINGALTAQGSAARPIVFTSHRDDTVAGDSNGDGDATTPAPANWEGLIFAAGGSGTLEHVALHWAGAQLSQYRSAAIHMASGATLAIRDSDISANEGWGIWAPTGSAASVQAQDNWWGSASGPYPYGTGQSVAYHTETDPWGRQYVVADVACDPWQGQTLWSGPSLGAVGWSGYDADPVNVSTGNFTYEASDLSIASRGLPLEVVRTYNSALPQDSPFGWGWGFSYNLQIETGLVQAASAYVAVTREDGSQHWYRVEQDGSYTPPAGIHDSLAALPGGGYELTTKDQTVYTFGANKRLSSVRDRNGNTTTLAYDANGISAVSAPDGRSLAITCNAAGHITSLADPLNRSWSYTYDAAGNLTSVSDPEGGVTTYTYDGEHRLLTIVDANGHTALTNTYDAKTGRTGSQSDARGNTTTFTYNLASGTTYARNPLGKTTTYVSNPRHCLTAVTTARGATTANSYDAANNKIATTDPLGRTTTFTYDARANLLSTTNAVNDTATTTYNARNDPLSKTDFAGRSWSYTYDQYGNLTETEDPLGHTTSHTYTGHGQLASSTDARGKTTAYTYNAHGYLTATAAPSGAVTSSTYDAAGRLLAKTNARGKTWSYGYDDLDRLIEVEDPLGRTTGSTYDAVGNETSSTDARGKTTTCLYDAANNLTKVTDAAGGETTYAYDAKNRLSSFSDARGKTTSYAYDDDGNRTSTTDALSRSHTATYDLAGNLLSMTDAKNQTTSYSYDLLNRVTQVTKPGSVTVDFTYDENGNTLTTVDARGSTSRTYNALGWLTSVTTPENKTVAYAYTATGERSRLSYPDTREASCSYDDDGRLASVTGPANDTTSYSYFADGNLETTTLPNGVTSSYTYDDAGHLASISHAKGATLLATSYTRDANGNPTAISDSRQGSSSYVYDDLNQLTEETRGGLTTAYTYDAVGNRLTKTVGGTKTAYSYDDASQLSSAGNATYTYDANGSRTGRTSGGTTTTYSYNADNLLTGTSSPSLTTSYLYDGENRRIAATENGSQTEFVLDTAVENELVLVETSGGQATTYTYGRSLISRESTAGISYLLTDALGSVRLETDSAGAIVTERTYDAFGLELGSPTMAGNRFRFTGQWSDAGGLTFLRARFYDPAVGGFLSVDPVPSVGSLYLYCGNNPLLYVDPSGKVLELYYGKPQGHLSSGQAASSALKYLAWCVVGVFDQEMRAWSGPGSYWGMTGALFLTPGPGGKVGAIGKAGSAARLQAVRVGSQGFRSFDSAKRTLGPAGPGHVWDHIVEQCQAKASRSGFASDQIHSTRNLQAVPKWVNQKKADFYSSSTKGTGGTLRDWLTGQSFEAQWEFGRDVTRRILAGEL